MALTPVPQNAKMDASEAVRALGSRRLKARLKGVVMSKPAALANISLGLIMALAALAVVAGFVLSGSEPAVAATAILNPSKDNTLYEYVSAGNCTETPVPLGDCSNGAGIHFFAGRTDRGYMRRGVLAFNVAGSIPAGSTITSVSLTLNASRVATNTARTVELHKLVADWGEGTSDASQNEGKGAPATTNDATWRHRFYNTVFWTAQGGDFSGTVSASQQVGANGAYTWGSTSFMVADVQSWLNNPSSNFGWLVKGDESTSTTAKRFDSRESNNPPALTIIYTPPSGTPTPTPTATGGTPPRPRRRRLRRRRRRLIPLSTRSMRRRSSRVPTSTSAFSTLASRSCRDLARTCGRMAAPSRARRFAGRPGRRRT